jgi:NAD(P)-dependent dehydrogenase (short-subunit alcohol dehydrogenase family)
MVQAMPIAEYALETFDKVMNLNVRAAFITAQAAVKRWQVNNKPGHLIFTSSWVQDVPWPEITPYTTSKSAMKMLARGFARELAPTIRANIVAPGIVGVGKLFHLVTCKPLKASPMPFCFYVPRWLPT